MDSNTAISDAQEYAPKRSRITEYELAAAKIKLIGLTILGLVCAVVLVVSPP